MPHTEPRSQLVPAILLRSLALAGLVLAVGTPRAAAAAESRPNFLFILADDLGWGDLGCYGHPQIQTPNLDRLAKQGTLFTHFYVNGSVCSPSRAAFLTGQYPARLKIHGHFAGRELNAARGMPDWLEPGVLNVPTVLRRAGYATAHVGKWHLGNDAGGPRTADYGFDFVGTSETGGAVGPPGDPHFRARSTALFVDETIKFIREHKDRPFYAQLWTLVPHATLNPTEEQMKPYARFGPGGDGFPHKGAAQVFYASVTDLDAQIGRLLDELGQLGLAEKTLVLFSSDNGPEDIHVRNAAHSGIGSAGPFRGRKRSLYEGGVRVPGIVRWPGRVPAGRVDSTSVVAGVDWLPTVSRLAGVAVPAGAALDGESVDDIFLGQTRERSRPLFWNWRFNIMGESFHRSPQLAVRDGPWKLLMNPDRSRAELYDVVHDPTQLSNVAGNRPEVVARLSDPLLAWHASLPASPVDASAGRDDYPWPGQTPAVRIGPGVPRKGEK